MERHCSIVHFSLHHRPFGHMLHQSYLGISRNDTISRSSMDLPYGGRAVATWHLCGRRIELERNEKVWRPAPLQVVQQVQARQMSSLSGVQNVYLKNGPPLSMDLQLRGIPELQVFLLVVVLRGH